jgi:hypothetical protein
MNITDLVNHCAVVHDVELDLPTPSLSQDERLLVVAEVAARESVKKGEGM